MLPALQAIVDVDAAARAGWAPRDLARAFLDGGARFLQLRAKALASGAFLDLCDAVVALGRDADAIVIVNDRVDLARLAGASGAHVGQEDLPVADARVLLGDEAVIGFSTHSVAQVVAALPLPATYLAVGPVFGTQTKATGYDAVGLDLVRQAVRLCANAGRVPSDLGVGRLPLDGDVRRVPLDPPLGRPLVAIGGITLDTAPSVIAAGAACVAVIGDLLATGNPEERVRAYCRALR